MGDGKEARDANRKRQYLGIVLLRISPARIHTGRGAPPGFGAHRSAEAQVSFRCCGRSRKKKNLKAQTPCRAQRSETTAPIAHTIGPSTGNRAVGNRTGTAGPTL